MFSTPVPIARRRAVMKLVDGSVRFISENIDSFPICGTGFSTANLHLYQRLFGKDDGHPVGEF
jgi:hypothetical protein